MSMLQLMMTTINILIKWKNKWINFYKVKSTKFQEIMLKCCWETSMLKLGERTFTKIAEDFLMHMRMNKNSAVNN